MAKKNDTYYFEAFSRAANISLSAAKTMHELLSSYEKHGFRDRLNNLHKEEHAGDLILHEVYENLVKAFITPIDREDIYRLAQNIDDITDAIEEVLICVYIGSIDTEIRPEIIEFAQKIIDICENVVGMLDEFSDFKHSKKLNEYIVRINSIEEECDIFYIGHMRSLHIHCEDARQLIIWRDIMKCLEDCADACEHVADVVESVVMKNS